MMKKHIILSVLLVLVSCQSEETLDKNSVLSIDKIVQTDLDKWLIHNYVHPYNIEVEYQFAQESAFDSGLLYAPNASSVMPVAQAVKAMGWDLLQQEMGNSFKSVLPLYVRLYRGANKDDQGIERMSIASNSPLRMTLFRVDEFVAKDEASAIRLMRNFFNNYAKLLIWKKPYDKVSFEKLNYLPYRKDIQKGGNIYELNSVVGGYFSLSAARFDSDEDFAETVSVLLSYSPSQVDEMIRQAGVAVSQDAQDVEKARLYQKTLEAKRQFVVDYFKNEYHIDLYQLSYLSLEKRQAYLK